MNVPNRRAALKLIGAAAALPTCVGAQTGRPVRFIIASSAGSTIDAIARSVQPRLESTSGSPWVVENVAGAGGVIAMQTLSRGPTDGSVLAFQTNNMVIAPLLVKPAPFDAVRDFTPVSIVGTIPLAVVVNASKVPSADPKEFIAFLKKNAQKFDYGSSGIGTTQHLAWELVQDELEIKLNHIPFKGVAPLINELLAGRIHAAALPLQIVQTHLQSGGLRAVGMLSEGRVPVAPELPTFAEAGLAHAKMEVWLGVIGPKGLQVSALNKLHEALHATFNTPTLKDLLEKQGNTIKVLSPHESLAVIQRDVQKYGALAKKINLIAT